MNIVTGYRGEAHITSQQDQAKNQGIFGSGSYILDVGQKLHAEAVSANEVRIYDGVLSHQGVVAVVEKNTYDSVTITSGSQGADRCDLIVARYTKEASTGVESMTFEVIMGTEGETTPPAYNTGDIQAGDSPVDMPIYEVHLSGIQIESLVPVASQIGNVNGAFMMNNILPSGDVNAATTPGAYEIVSTNTYTGLPTGITEGVLTVSKAREGGFITHTLTAASATWLRTLNESEWSTWQLVIGRITKTYTHAPSNIVVLVEKTNRFCRIRIGGTTTAEVAAAGDKLLCTLDDEYKPVAECTFYTYITPSLFAPVSIRTNGEVYLGALKNWSGSSAPLPSGARPRAEAAYMTH